MSSNTEPEPLSLKSIKIAAADIASAGSNLDEDTRQKALGAARELVRSLEKPFDVIWHWSFELNSQRMAMRVALDMGVYAVLTRADGQHVKAQELADACKAEKLFTVRIMRVLIAMGFIDEVGFETYAANELTRTLAEEVIGGVVRSTYDILVPVEGSMHKYFKEKGGYKSPTDPKDCPIQWSLNTPLTYFEYIHQDPELTLAFSQLMARWRGLTRHWTEWYPVQTNILDGIVDSDENVILVDIGGHKGYDLEIFIKNFPSTQGRVVLQDLPIIINTVGHLAPAIKPLAYDFFTPQPIKGARVYFMHIILHDWADDICRNILRQLISAMRPGYSKLLLNEVVLPDQKCPAVFAAADINMMSVLAGMERSRSHWIELIESVGLKVVKIYTSPFIEDTESVIEAILES